MKKNIIIIGCSISSLYAGIKCLEAGHDVTTLERKNNISSCSDENQYYNYQLYNSAHISYINLLKSYGISGKVVKSITYDDDFYALLDKIKHAIKGIHYSILSSCSVVTLFHRILTYEEFNIISKFIDNVHVSNLLNTINVIDFINVFSKDITKSTYYFLDNVTIDYLITRMIDSYTKKGGKIVYNCNVASIRYVKKYFLLNNNIMCELLLTTISKKNLLKFGFWKENQKMLLNSVEAIESTAARALILKSINAGDWVFNHKQSKNINKFLLDELHIVYPNSLKQSNDIYFWKYDTNSLLIRENIKNIYNDKFVVCSESYSKNNMFINYSIEYIDNAIYCCLSKYT